MMDKNLLINLNWNEQIFSVFLKSSVINNILVKKYYEENELTIVLNATNLAIYIYEKLKRIFTGLGLSHYKYYTDSEYHYENELKIDLNINDDEDMFWGNPIFLIAANLTDKKNIEKQISYKLELIQLPKCSLINGSFSIRLFGNNYKIVSTDASPVFNHMVVNCLELELEVLGNRFRLFVPYNIVQHLAKSLFNSYHFELDKNLIYIVIDLLISYINIKFNLNINLIYFTDSVINNYSEFQQFNIINHKYGFSGAFFMPFIELNKYEVFIRKLFKTGNATRIIERTHVFEFSLVNSKTLIKFEQLASLKPGDIIILDKVYSSPDNEGTGICAIIDFGKFGLYVKKIGSKEIEIIDKING